MAQVKFRLWLQSVSLMDSHMPWTQHLIVFFGQPLIMASRPVSSDKTAQRQSLFSLQCPQVENCRDPFIWLASGPPVGSWLRLPPSGGPQHYIT